MPNSVIEQTFLTFPTTLTMTPPTIVVQDPIVESVGKAIGGAGLEVDSPFGLLQGRYSVVFSPAEEVGLVGVQTCSSVYLFW